jgi:hypothetical protein
MSFLENLNKRKAWQILKNEIETERHTTIKAEEKPVE